MSTIAGIVITRHGLVDHDTRCLDQVGMNYAQDLPNHLRNLDENILQKMGWPQADNVNDNGCKRCIATVKPLADVVSTGFVMNFENTSGIKGLQRFNVLKRRIQRKNTPWYAESVRIDDYEAILKEMKVSTPKIPREMSHFAYTYFYTAEWDGRNWTMIQHATEQILPSPEELERLEAEAEQTHGVRI